MEQYHLFLMLVVFNVAVITFIIAGFVMRRRVSNLSLVALGDSLLISAGVSAIKGRRETMEDAHTIVLDLMSSSSSSSNQTTIQPLVSRSKACLFAIFDGHCGSKCSVYASKYLSVNLSQDETFSSTNDPVRICESICNAFRKTDLDFLRIASGENLSDGSTACTAIIVDDSIYVANSGDSRCVMGRINTETLNIMPIHMSVDHKPSRPSERIRIEASGGLVHPTHIPSNRCVLSVGPQRVWPGGLSVSRGLGDLMMKNMNDLNKQGVTSELITSYPEIRFTSLSYLDQFVVIGCDGLYDVMTSAEVVNFINETRPKVMVRCMKDIIRRNKPKCSLAHNSAIGSVFRSKSQTSISLDTQSENIPEVEESPVLDEARCVSEDDAEKEDMIAKVLISGVIRPETCIHYRFPGTMRLLSGVIRMLKRLYFHIMANPLNLTELYYATRDVRLDENIEFTDEMLYLADCQCAQILAEKLTTFAYERAATDNISVLVVLFRWKGITPTTINDWKNYARTVVHASVLSEQNMVGLEYEDPSDETNTCSQNSEISVWIHEKDPAYSILKDNYS